MRSALKLWKVGKTQNICKKQTNEVYSIGLTNSHNKKLVLPSLYYQDFTFHQSVVSLCLVNFILLGLLLARVITLRKRTRKMVIPMQVQAVKITTAVRILCLETQHG